MKKNIYLKVKVKIGSSKERVEYKEDTYFVYTNSPARDNKANLSVISLLSEYLNIPKSYISIQRGLKSKNKIITISRE